MKPGQWKPGQSGNPGGRPCEKVFTDSLRLVGNETDAVSGKRKMRRLAEKVYELALQGESWALPHDRGSFGRQTRGRNDPECRAISRCQGVLRSGAVGFDRSAKADRRDAR